MLCGILRSGAFGQHLGLNVSEGRNHRSQKPSMGFCNKIGTCETSTMSAVRSAYGGMCCKTLRCAAKAQLSNPTEQHFESILRACAAGAQRCSSATSS